MAIETQSTAFEIGDGALSTTPDYTEVKEVASFSAFDGTAAEITTTHLKSTAQEFLIGLPDNGQLSMDCNFVSGDAGQDALRAFRKSRAVTAFRITFSDATVATFDCYVMGASIGGAVDDKVDTSFTLRITGEVTGI